MKSKQKISRKEFIRNILVVLAAPVIFFWLMSVKRYREMYRNRSVRLPDDVPEGISIIDEVIISKQNGKIEAFSAKCTHLGCIITETGNKEIVCPCHGSRFNADGYPVKGPAVDRLKELKIERQDGKILIEVPS